MKCKITGDELLALVSADGRRVDVRDDGHTPGNAGRPNSRRQAIESMLKKKSKLDGKPVWMMAEEPKPFTAYGHRMEPISVGRVVEPDAAARVEAHQEEAKARTQARVPPSASRQALAASIAEASAKAAQGTDAASTRTGADAAKAKASKDGGA